MEKIIHLASGIRIGVEVGGVVHGFCAGDIITAKEVIVEGFAGGEQGKTAVIWGRVATEETCDCAHDSEGLFLLRRAAQSAV